MMGWTVPPNGIKRQGGPWRAATGRQSIDEFSTIGVDLGKGFFQVHGCGPRMAIS